METCGIWGREVGSKQKETWTCVNAGGKDLLEEEIKDTGKSCWGREGLTERLSFTIIRSTSHTFLTLSTFLRFHVAMLHSFAKLATVSKLF